MNLVGPNIHIKDLDSFVAHYNLKYDNRESNLWTFVNRNSHSAVESDTNETWSDDSNNYEDSVYAPHKMRDIRLMLSRHTSTRISLLEVLKNIQKGKINPAPYTPESNLLQRYLLDTIRHILKQERSIENESLITLIRDIEDRIIPGTNNELFEKLKMVICIRPQILKKVQEFVEQRELLELSKGYNTEIVMKKNEINISNGKNIIINQDVENLKQKISHSLNSESEINKDKIADLLRDIAKEIEAIKQKISDEDYDDIKTDYEDIDREINREEPRKGRLNTYFNNFLDTVKKIGEAGAPLVKLAGGIVAFL
jgi:hypothetical protein